jgi:hypothetical protein
LIFRFTILLLFISGIAHAQLGDSFHIRIAGDTVLQKSISRVDSLAVAFQSNADSINTLVQSTIQPDRRVGCAAPEKSIMLVL